MTDLPAVLSAESELAMGQACHCFCGARHSDHMGVCAGKLTEPGYRLWFNSLYDTEGVVVCAPCWAEYPEHGMSDA